MMIDDDDDDNDDDAEDSKDVISTTHQLNDIWLSIITEHWTPNLQN